MNMDLFILGWGLGVFFDWEWDGIKTCLLLLLVCLLPHQLRDWEEKKRRKERVDRTDGAHVICRQSFSCIHFPLHRLQEQDLLILLFSPIHPSMYLFIYMLLFSDFFGFLHYPFLHLILFIQWSFFLLHCWSDGSKHISWLEHCSLWCGLRGRERNTTMPMSSANLISLETSEACSVECRTHQINGLEWITNHGHTCLCIGSCSGLSKIPTTILFLQIRVLIGEFFFLLSV